MFADNAPEYSHARFQGVPTPSLERETDARDSSYCLKLPTRAECEQAWYSNIHIGYTFKPPNHPHSLEYVEKQSHNQYAIDVSATSW